MLKILLVLSAVLAVALGADASRPLDQTCFSQSTVIDTFNPQLYPDVPSRRFEITFLEDTANGNLVAKPHPQATGSSTGWAFAATSFGTPPNVGQEILGGNRDIILYLDTAESSIGNQLATNVVTDNQLGADTLSFSSDTGLNGVIEIQYDGPGDQSNPRFLDTSGLGGINFASISTQLIVTVTEIDLPTTFVFEAYEQGTNNFVSHSVTIDQTTDSSNGFDVLLNFETTNFVENGATGVEVFSNLGAFRIFVFSANTENRAIDGAIVNIGIDAGVCIFKQVSSDLAPANVNLNTFAVDFYNGAGILNGQCDTDDLTIGDTVQFGIEILARGSNTISFTLRDQIANNLALNTGSVLVSDFFGNFNAQFNDRSTSSEVIVDVTLDFPASVADEYVDVFFQATIVGNPVNMMTCEGEISNSARLEGDYTIDSNTVEFCVMAMPTLIMDDKFIDTPGQSDDPLVSAGGSFGISNSISNVGNLNAKEAVFSVEISQGGVTVSSDNSGFFDTVTTSGNGLLYSKSYTPFNIGREENIDLTFDVAVNYEGGPINVQCCWTTENTGVPDRCEKRVCENAVILVEEESDPRICKRGRLIRKIVYNVDYFNVGDGAANDVVISEVVPAGTSFNAAESDSRWACITSNGVTDCTIGPFVLGANVAECAVFVVDLLDDTEVCTTFHNTATIDYDDNQRTDIDIRADDSASFSIVQFGCPLPTPPPPPPEPECCMCPDEPLCPCPEPDPCDECMPKDTCGGNKKATTINFDFGGKDMEW